MDISVDVPVPASHPHKFPASYRTPKRVHRIRLGRKFSNAILKRSIFMVFALDPQYGICPIALVLSRHIRVNARTGKAHIDVRTNYPKDRIVVYNFPLSKANNSTENAQKLMASVHRALIRESNSTTPIVMWKPPYGNTRGALRQTLSTIHSEDSTNVEK